MNVRLFVALEIPAAVRDNLAAFIKEMQSGAFRDMRDVSQPPVEKRVRWVSPENLHVTLKFIGEVPDAKLEGIRAALSTVRTDMPVELQFRGLAFFPDENLPTVLWTTVKASTNLQSLATDIDRTLATQGIAKEKRTFVPHLTLARFLPPGLNEKLLTAIHKNGQREFEIFQTHEFQLIKSKLEAAGAEYTTLQSFHFSGEA